MHIKDIRMNKRVELVWFFKKIRAIATVYVEDENQKPVKGALVRGTWSGNAINSCEEYTDSSGKIISSSEWYWSSRGEFIFTVQSVQKDNMKYKPENNRKTSGKVRI